jgi:CheY-like chemotaxis protein
LSFLAVEDHEFQRSVLLKVLAGLGATKVRVVADGREPTFQLRQYRPVRLVDTHRTFE